MNQQAQDLTQRTKQWLSHAVLPVWRAKGFDAQKGFFVESLDKTHTPSPGPARVLVQCRQIYSFSEAARLGLIDPHVAKEMIAANGRFLIENCQLPDGGYGSSATSDGQLVSKVPEFYTQAFVLFSFARAFQLLRDPKIKENAIRLVEYLNSQRRASNGGFTEIKQGMPTFQSNPHMHFFEAIIEWCHADSDPIWSGLATSLANLAEQRFFDQKVGCICEFFDEEWHPLTQEGRFLFEPGHQYEWAWLFSRYEEIAGNKMTLDPKKLFQLAEQVGVRENFVIDEVWSDLTPKKESSRFWPQCERIKAAVTLGQKAPHEDRARFAQAADEALASLTSYFAEDGTWRDTRSTSGEFDHNPSKGTSLYHIMGALSEYFEKRPTL